MSNQKIIERINALLALANNTPYPDEAETAFRQANKLIIKHSVDEAMLEAARAEKEGVTAFKVDRDIWYAFAPSARAKVVLASWLGTVIGVEVTYRKDTDGDYSMTWHGSKSNIELLGILYLETAKFGNSELQRVKKEYNAKGRRFTDSFWASYNSRVYLRAKEMLEEVLSEIPGAELVLLSQMQAIEKSVKDANPDGVKTVSWGGNANDQLGLLLGDESGENANISIHKRLEGANS